MISYAQAREDVLLHRALHHIPFDQGFYIDVGGYDPERDSVTKHFYDHGEALFPPFEQARPRDINLKVAVSDTAGQVTFHEVEGQLGTLVDKFADRHAAAGFARSSYTVEAMTLTQICEQHAPREIHFLKIDIEGHEAAAIRGMDFARFRPWILVIESCEPNDLSKTTHHEWESMVVAAGYRFAYGDVLNRYYVADEHIDLMRHFTIPADDYHYGYVIAELHELRAERATLAARVELLERQIGATAGRAFG
jgi:FkbM family methyltransferase